MREVRGWEFRGGTLGGFVGLLLFLEEGFNLLFLEMLGGYSECVGVGVRVGLEEEEEEEEEEVLLGFEREVRGEEWDIGSSPSGGGLGLKGGLDLGLRLGP
jgi:hypothetical protein